jgi:hypothetical protein
MSITVGVGRATQAGVLVTSVQRPARIRRYPVQRCGVGATCPATSATFASLSAPPSSSPYDAGPLRPAAAQRSPQLLHALSRCGTSSLAERPAREAGEPWSLSRVPWDPRSLPPDASRYPVLAWDADAQRCWKLVMKGDEIAPQRTASNCARHLHDKASQPAVCRHVVEAPVPQHGCSQLR